MKYILNMDNQVPKIEEQYKWLTDYLLNNLNYIDHIKINPFFAHVYFFRNTNFLDKFTGNLIGVFTNNKIEVPIIRHSKDTIEIFYKKDFLRKNKLNKLLNKKQSHLIHKINL